MITWNDENHEFYYYAYIYNEPDGEKYYTEYSTGTYSTPCKTAAPSKVIDATQAEMHKCLIKYGSFQPIQYGDIETTAIRLPSIIFYKQKDLDLKARLVVCGAPNYIPSDARSVTYAGAADPANIIVVDAAYRADAIHRNALNQLITFTTDIPPAYLQNKLTRQDTAGHQVVMKLPTKLPHPLAGTWVELIQSQYGLPWSNSIHARELTLTLATAGFHPAHVQDMPTHRWIDISITVLIPSIRSSSPPSVSPSTTSRASGSTSHTSTSYLPYYANDMAKK